MSFVNDVSSSTPAEKLSQLTSNIQSILQELNEPKSPHGSSSSTIQPKPLFDGSPEQLVPFLNCLDIRHQDEGWYTIIFLNIGKNKLDLTRHFAKLDGSVMLNEAKLHWISPTVNTDKHTIDHPTYNARVLGRLLLHSIDNDLP
jgi:hypothetical protein